MLSHEFVDVMPNELKPGVIYISVKYSTAIHLCCCGCGTEVVTPLSPADWTLIFDGDSVSLWPSIGNWGLECQSHYWIEQNRVRWARRWSREEILSGRAADLEYRGRSISGMDRSSFVDALKRRPLPKAGRKPSLIGRFKKWILDK